jgi:hypothetical protein
MQVQRRILHMLNLRIGGKPRGDWKRMIKALASAKREIEAGADCYAMNHYQRK